MVAVWPVRLKRYTSAAPATHHFWKEYFTDPSTYNKKTRQRSSDNLKSLWIDGWCNFTWLANGIHMQQQLQQRELLSLEQALAALERMPHPTSVENLTCILRKCKREKKPAYVLRLHAYMCKNGLEAHRFLGNYLVPMLVEVGSICDAQQVFDRLVDRNEYSWTSLIAGYIERGELQHAFILYQKMQEDSVHPNGYTFVALLKACSRLKDAKRGQEIHAEICTQGLVEKDPFVGNALVDMYAKCGLLAKAWEVFDKLPVRDAVSWNALITGNAEHGHGQEALNCFEQMKLEGISPDAFTFVCSLKACSGVRDIEKGIEIHAEIAAKGLLRRDPFVGNALVDMYAKCGLLAKAQEVFDKLPVRDAISWNALIAGNAEHGLSQEALNYFEQMQLEGIIPDVITFVCSLKSCGSIGAVEKGIEIHAEIATKGLLERDPFVGNALVDMYAKCGLLAKAHEVFDKLPVRDAVSWNALIAGNTEHGLGQEALTCFEQMQLEGITPSVVTCVCIFKACGSIGAIEKGTEVHTEIARKGLFEQDLFIGSTLVDMYAKCGLLAKAQEVFDNLQARDSVSWTALMAGYAEHGLGLEALNCFKQMQLEGTSPTVVTFVFSLKACGSIGAIEKGIELHAELDANGLLESNPFIGSSLVDMYAKCGLLAKAQEVFDEFPVQDTVSWSALIAGYVEHGLGQEALHCFEQMELEGVSPNAVTYVCSLKACGNVGAVEKAMELHAKIAKKQLLERDPFVGNTLVDMYAKCGLFTKAQKVFDELPVRDAVSWNSLIAGYAHIGESENVFLMLDRMGAEDIKPDGVTFLSILTVCSHTGLVEKGQTYFEVMCKDYGITPTLEHYTCMVDLLGRAGQLDKAIVMMKNMPCNPNAVLWHTVLGACRKWGNVDLGRWAFEHAVQLDKKEATAYVLMSNIYADAHLQQETLPVEVTRPKEQAWKTPGQSWWAHVGRTAHLFLVGDTGHSLGRYTYARPFEMRKEGYSPDLHWMSLDISDDVNKARLCGHCEKLAVACALINPPKGALVHNVKNIQVCKDCHLTTTIFNVEQRTVLVRRANCFHVFKNS